MKTSATKKRASSNGRKKAVPGRDKKPRRKSRALAEKPATRAVTRSCPISNASPIDALIGDLPAITLRDSQEVLSHFERIDPRLAEAWKRDVVVHDGPITLRRVMSPANFGGATHYAYVDRRLLWYLRHDPSNPVGACWEGYLATASDAPAGTIGVPVGRNIVVKRSSPQLAGDQLRLLEGLRHH